MPAKAIEFRNGAIKHHVDMRCPNNVLPLDLGKIRVHRMASLRSYTSDELCHCHPVPCHLAYIFSAHHSSRIHLWERLFVGTAIEWPIIVPNRKYANPVLLDEVRGHEPMRGGTER